MCWRERTRLLNDFRFSIADFRLGEKSDARHIAETIFGFFLRQSKIQNRKSKVGGAFANRFRPCGDGAVAQAQQPKKVPRIGFLAGVSPSTISARTEAFRQGLRELGYVEGKNIIIEWRYAEEKLDRLNDLAAELVRLKVEVIVSAAPMVTRSIKESTKTIPIVMAFDDDP